MQQGSRIVDSQKVIRTWSFSSQVLYQLRHLTLAINLTITNATTFCNQFYYKIIMC